MFELLLIELLDGSIRINMPEETIFKICFYLPVIDLINFSRVNRKAYLTVTKSNQWKDIYQEHFPHRYELLVTALSKPGQELNFNTIEWKTEYARDFPTQYQSLQAKQHSNWYPRYLYDSFRKANAEEQEGFAVTGMFSSSAENNKLSYLLYAIKAGDLDRIKKIKFTATDLLTRINKNTTILSLARQIHAPTRADILKYFFDEIILKNTSTSGPNAQVSGISVAHWAVLCQQEYYINSSKFPVNAVDLLDRTSLYYAAETGYAQGVKLLLAKGANINARNINGYTALCIALINEHIAVVEALLADPKINIFLRTARLSHPERHKDIYSNANPLSIAVQRGKKDIVNLLIEKEITLNDPTHNPPSCVPDKNNEIPLHHAARAGYVAIVAILLKPKSVKINAQNRHGNTPLYLAAENKHVEVVKLLLSYKNTVVNTEMQSYVFLEGTQINIGTALHAAVLARAADVVDELLSNKNKTANPNAWGESQRTPLHNAATKGEVKCAEVLIKHKADINALDKDRESPLFYAVRNGKLEFVQLLLKHGVNVLLQATNTYFGDIICIGDTALHFAARLGHADIVRAFLAHTTNTMNVQNNAGKTPLQVAKGNAKTVLLAKQLEEEEAKKTTQPQTKPVGQQDSKEEALPVDSVSTQNTDPTDSSKPAELTPTISRSEFKKAIDAYMLYKDNRYFGLSWLRSSTASIKAARDMETADDAKRYEIAMAYVRQHGEKAFAEKLMATIPTLLTNYLKPS